MDAVHKAKRILIHDVVEAVDTVWGGGVFWGQEAQQDKPERLHIILIEKAKTVYAVDHDFASMPPAAILIKATFN
jgi:hypothetical protein